jgi:hypothetical protein
MLRHLCILFVVLCLTPPAFAAKVLKVKGRSALVSLEGESAGKGDLFYATLNGHKKAILKLVKVKGDKAIAKILKGRAAAGMAMVPRGNGGHARASNDSSSSGDSSSSSLPITGRSYWGGLLGFSMDSMNVNVNSATNVSLSGTGFSAKGLFDYELFPQVWFRGMAGVEQFAANGPAECLGATCDAKIMYFDLDFLGRYVFSKGNFRPWAGLGLGLLFPATKSSTALDSGSIGSTNVIIPAVGLDWFINPKMYVPISLEYGLLPNSSEVKAHWIELRAGLAIPF